MIIGTGMIANAFKDYIDDTNIIIFAKGVSNSQEKNEKNFKRESDLLKSTLKSNQNKTIVYFGTCSVNDSESKNTPYVLHKLNMEKLIQESGLDYYIFRLPQVVGNTTSPTLINFLANQITRGEIFNVWKYSARDLIDIEDVYKISDYLIKHELSQNNVINIASGITVGINEIIQKIEKKLMKKGNFHEINKGTTYKIDISEIKLYLKSIDVHFSDNYVDNLINKYVSKDTLTE